MTARRVVGLDELRARFEVIHGARKTEAAYRQALLDVSLSVWRDRLATVERLRGELEAALVEADDWRAICEGHAHGAARAWDAARRPPAARSVVVYGDDGEPRTLFAVAPPAEDDGAAQGP